MKVAISLAISLALVATAFSVPIYNINSQTDSLNDWTADYLVGNNRLRLAFGWKKDGTVAAGAAVHAIGGNAYVPVGAVVSSNINDMKQFQYEIGSQLNDVASAVLFGDHTGNIRYKVGGNVVAVGSVYDNTVIGASVEGDNQRLKVVEATIGANGESIKASVGLGERLVPETLEVGVGIA